MAPLVEFTTPDKFVQGVGNREREGEGGRRRRLGNNVLDPLLLSPLLSPLLVHPSFIEQKKEKGTGTVCHESLLSDRENSCLSINNFSIVPVLDYGDNRR